MAEISPPWPPTSASVRDDTARLHLASNPSPPASRTTEGNRTFFKDLLWNRRPGRGSESACSTEEARPSAPHIGGCFDTVPVALQFEIRSKAIRPSARGHPHLHVAGSSAALGPARAVPNAGKIVQPIADPPNLHHVERRGAAWQHAFRGRPAPGPPTSTAAGLEEPHAIFHVPLFFKEYGLLSQHRRPAHAGRPPRTPHRRHHHLELRPNTFDVLPPASSRRRRPQPRPRIPRVVMDTSTLVRGASLPLLERASFSRFRRVNRPPTAAGAASTSTAARSTSPRSPRREGRFTHGSNAFPRYPPDASFSRARVASRHHRLFDARRIDIAPGHRARPYIRVRALPR